MKSASKFLSLAFFVSLTWLIIQLNPAQARSQTEPVVGREKQSSVIQTSPTLQPQETTSGKPQKATHTPQPSPLPVPTPPPSNPDTIQTMIIFGVLIVVVVIFGIWLNRNRVF